MPGEFDRTFWLSREPSETFEYCQALFPEFGIASVADMTGFDRTGLPVTFVTRPNSCSQTIQQGKGLTIEAAITSGVMEAVELFHAENVSLATETCSGTDICRTGGRIAWDLLPKLSGTGLTADTCVVWTQAAVFGSGEPVWVPFEMVHADFSLPFCEHAGYFPCTSTGLAAGNTLNEAVVHGICEVIERDAATLFAIKPVSSQTSRAINLATIHNPTIQRCIEKIENAGLLLGVWDMTTDVGVPAVVARICDPAGHHGGKVITGGGEGCHPLRETAVLRAITEAAQSRVKHLTGMEVEQASAHPLTLDDLPMARPGDSFPGDGPSRNFQSLPDLSFTSLDEVLRWLVSRLGKFSACVVDLSKPEFDVSVVRVIVPGLEDGIGTPGYSAGLRATAALENGLQTTDHP